MFCVTVFIFTKCNIDSYLYDYIRFINLLLLVRKYYLNGKSNKCILCYTTLYGHKQLVNAILETNVIVSCSRKTCANT